MSTHHAPVASPRWRASTLALVLAALPLPAPAAEPPASSPPAASPAAARPAGQVDEQLFADLKWRLVGPFRGGRALAVEGVPGEPNTYYFGAVAGGVWKTTDGGANWAPLFEHQAVSSIGALAVAPSDHNILYVGTGEAAIRGDISYGDGVYKSLDGGKSWHNVGLKDTRQIGALIVHPNDPNTVFVAALGHAFGPNAERGIFRTTNGGKSWQKVLGKDENTGGIDVVFDPHNPNILFAALWQTRRQSWYFSSGGSGSGLYRSGDGGATWKRLEGNGLPDGILGKIGVSVSGADGNRVYASIEAKEGGLFRSDDGGEHWERINEDGRFRQRAWYFSTIYADPKSVDTVYVLNTGLYRSTDGAKSFELLPATHGDHHGLWIDPQNPNRLINANDGGASVSIDAGHTWTTLDNQPTAQLYHVAVDNAFPYHIYGAQQDNSNLAIASYSDDGVIGRADWYPAGGGECGFVLPDPRDWHIVYSDSESDIVRYNKREEQSQDISVYPLDVSGHGAVDLKYRFQWTSPLMLSPHDPDTLYTAAQYVFKTTDHGVHWRQISPDLTRDDKTKQQPSGGPLTRDITSVEYYDTVFALAESPRQKGLLWAGSDDGLVHLSTDDGGHWEDVTPPGLPEWSTIDLIEASPHDTDTAYLAVDRHKLDDIKPYIYKTTDSGHQWTQINSGLPDGAFVHAVREDPVRPGLLYAGTEIGVFVSFDDGGNWQPLQLNLPTSPVHDLVVKGDDLVIGTHGRSFWVLDDITPLRELGLSGSGVPDLWLHRPQTALRLHYPDEVNKHGPVGENPPPGAIIDYYFKTAPKGEVVLEILDAKGQVVRRLSSQEEKKDDQPPEWPDRVEEPKTIPAHAGLNRYAWNLRYEEPVQIPGAFYSDDGPEGPLALPGDYTVRLSADGKSLTSPLKLALDPRVKDGTGLPAQFALALQTREQITALHRAVNEIRDVKAQVVSLHRRFGDDARLKPAFAATDELNKKLSAVEELLIQVDMKGSEANLAFPNMLNEEYDSFSHTIEGADTAPTQPLIEVGENLSQRLGAQLKIWAQIKADDLPKVDALIRQSDVPALFIPPEKNAEADHDAAGTAPAAE
jgi:photosystem II stability/assembly factor-like uncharacterized protein